MNDKSTEAMSGDCIMLKEGRMDGTLWERASDLDAYPVGRHGYVLAFRIMEGAGAKAHALPRQYATRDAAQEALEELFSEEYRAMFGSRVIVAPYVTKSGNPVKLRTTEEEK